MNEFITIAEAIKITGKSKSTIRRFVHAHSENSAIIRQQRNAKNRPLFKLNKAFLLSYYSLDNKNENFTGSTNHGNKLEFEKKLLLLNEFITNQKKQYKVIITSLILVFIITCIIGLYYHYQLVDKLKDELNFYIKYHTSSQKTYEVSKHELKDAYRNLLNEKQGKIDKLEEDLKEYKAKAIESERQINALEKDKNALLGKITSPKS